MSKAIQTRGQQPLSNGLGKHFTSPTKARDKRKTTVIVRLPGQETKRRRLLEKLQRLQNPKYESPSTDLASQVPLDEPCSMDIDIDNDGWEDIQPKPAQSESSQPTKVPRRILPDTESGRLYAAWKHLLPSLVNSLIDYMSTSTGHIVIPAMDLNSKCEQSSCAPKDTKVLCLHFDRKLAYPIHSHF
jgi:hypothetical protein